MRHAEEDGPHDLNALKGLGVGLAIDDFGTGYSSLSYLHDLPFDALKIDKSFIDEITVSPRRMDLVRGIIRIADSLGLYVVAEGLESEHQRTCWPRPGAGTARASCSPAPSNSTPPKHSSRPASGRLISGDWQDQAPPAD